MAASYQYVNSSGLVLADTADIISDVEAEFQNALGADAIATPDTPQGVLITQEAQARANVMNNNAVVANQINPNYAGGAFLEAICAFTDLQRSGATFTQVENVLLTGVAGTVVPQGTQGATTGGGDIFATNNAVTLDGSGNGTVNFTAAVAGPIPCPEGTLTKIVAATAVLGLETITNPADGIQGQIEQTDNQLRQLRNNTLGNQGHSGPASQIAALFNVPGVTSVKYLENLSDAVQVIEGITMAAHSVWACVAGGSANAIGQALLDSKTAGAGWNGVQFVNVTESSSGQVYVVQYDIPTQIGFKVSITLSQGTSPNVLTQTGPQAVVDYANGLLSDEPGLVIGASVSPFDIAAAIQSENPGVRVREVQVALKPSGAYQTTEIAIATNQQATISISDIQTNLI